MKVWKNLPFVWINSGIFWKNSRNFWKNWKKWLRKNVPKKACLSSYIGTSFNLAPRNWRCVYVSLVLEAMLDVRLWALEGRRICLNSPSRVKPRRIKSLEGTKDTTFLPEVNHKKPTGKIKFLLYTPGVVFWFGRWCGVSPLRCCRPRRSPCAGSTGSTILTWFHWRHGHQCAFFFCLRKWP